MDHLIYAKTLRSGVFTITNNKRKGTYVLFGRRKIHGSSPWSNAEFVA
jgi:hypothetical protein